MIYKNYTNVFTVCTYSYLNLALVAMKSFTENNHTSRNFIFVIDAGFEAISYLNNHNISRSLEIIFFGVDQLSKNYKSIFTKASSYFDSMELCSLAKYIGTDHILSSIENSNLCTYIDADTFFLSSIKKSLEFLKDKSLLVTPHYVEPAYTKSQLLCLRSGWINSGFLIFNREERNYKNILNWLISRVSNKGFMVPEIGLYCDQRWLSLASQIFSESILVSKDPCLNIGYWNLNERKIVQKSNFFYLKKRRISFFHFSGHKINSPEKLTVHNDTDFNENDSKSIALKNLLKKYYVERLSLNVSLSNQKLNPVCDKDVKKRIKLSCRYNKDNEELLILIPNLYEKIIKKIIFIVKTFFK